MVKSSWGLLGAGALWWATSGSSIYAMIAYSIMVSWYRDTAAPGHVVLDEGEGPGPGRCESDNHPPTDQD